MNISKTDSGGVADKSVTPSFNLSRLKRIAVILLLSYIGVCILMFSIQRMLLFAPSKILDRNPGHYKWQYEDVYLEVGKEKTHGWYIPHENEKGVALFSHGNAGNIAGRLESVGLLRSFGFSVFLYDYGGYGESTGKTTEDRCYADITGAWNYLQDVKDYKQDEILLFGRSLGGGVTCELASKVEPGATIIESTFLSIPDMAQQVLPYVPAKWLVLDKFSNKDKIADIKSPLLLVHSPDDSIIPYSHGKKLFEIAGEPKKFLEINGDHNLGFVISEDIYKKGWTEFLEEHFYK